MPPKCYCAERKRNVWRIIFFFCARSPLRNFIRSNHAEPFQSLQMWLTTIFRKCNISNNYVTRSDVIRVVATPFKPAIRAARLVGKWKCQRALKPRKILRLNTLFKHYSGAFRRKHFWNRRLLILQMEIHANHKSIGGISWNLTKSTRAEIVRRGYPKEADWKTHLKYWGEPHGG